MAKAKYLDSNGELIEYQSETILPHGNFRIVYEASFTSYKIQILEWEHGTERYTYQLFSGTVLLPTELKGYKTIQDALVVAFRQMRDDDKEDYIASFEVIRIFDEIPTELLRPLLLKAFIHKFSIVRILAKLNDMHMGVCDEVQPYDFEAMTFDEIANTIVDRIKTYKSKIGKVDTIEELKTGQENAHFEK